MENVERLLPISCMSRPLLIGIAGDSGSGKDRTVRLLKDLLGGEDVTTVTGDDYHRWERGAPQLVNLTHLHPNANELSQLETDIFSLVEGRGVFRPVYDHSSGRFSKPRYIRPAKTIIVQGLHALYLQRMRESFDLRVFLSPHPLLRLAWKASRDTTERGYGLAEVLESVERRNMDSRNFISPQRKFADWIIEYFPLEELTREKVLEGSDIEVGVRHSFRNDVPFQDWVKELKAAAGREVSLRIDSSDLNRVILEFRGNAESEEIARLARRAFPDIGAILGNGCEARWQAGHDGVAQLIAVSLLKKGL